MVMYDYANMNVYMNLCFDFIKVFSSVDVTLFPASKKFIAPNLSYPDMQVACRHEERGSSNSSFT